MHDPAAIELLHTLYFLVTFQMTSLPSRPAVETLATSPLLPHS